MCVYVTRCTTTHTANTHHVGDVLVFFFRLDDHSVSADRSVNRRRRGSRSLRRARSPNSWRHDNNTLRYHCALAACVRTDAIERDVTSGTPKHTFLLKNDRF